MNEAKNDYSIIMMLSNYHEMEDGCFEEFS